MLTMAHHPQKSTHQVNSHDIENSKPHYNHLDNHSKHIRQPRGRTITSHDDNKFNDTDARSQPRPLGQEGKRTLIKNQLYLIEQLQLENANLRNERDQLQLENEELKFQLQMISSSNILGQSSAAFNEDRQLDRLVQPDNTAANTHNPTVIDNLSAQQAASSRPSSCVPTSHFTTTATDRSNRHHGQQGITPTLGLTKSMATQSRQQFWVKKQTNGQQLYQSDTNGTTGLDRCEPGSLAYASTHHDENIPQSSRMINETPSNTRSLSAKSTSLSALNVGAVSVPTPFSMAQADDLLTIDQDEQDDDRTQSKLAHQLYGDSREVRAAAITIQRAFRKYQIFKRFRMITEQLRHASKTSPIHSVGQDRKQQFNEDVKNAQIPFASGTTRAAAWESLSQAASRLAATAASATASTKQVFSNGVTKSASGQQVVTATRDQNQANGQNKRSETPLKAGLDKNNTGSSSQFKANPVVEAAINFQQLESIRKRQYRVGLNVFNKSPEKGVSFLIAHSFIDSSPPYAKTSHSYYLSNQLHFIDKQQLTAHQQSITTGINGVFDVKLDYNCRLCREEENLKRNVAHFLLHRKGLAREKIGQYLGNLQCRFNQDVLIYYLQELDFNGLQVDVALRKFSSTMRMPGEAQKIERFVDCFAQRYVQCQQAQQMAANDFANANQPIHLSANHGVVRVDTDWNVTNQTNGPRNHTAKNNLTMLTKDEIFILTFAIIMLNTDLHSPSLKSTSRMSASQFINNLRGVFKSQTINETDLIEIYERVKANQITTTPDHVAHVMKVQQGLTTNNFQKKELPNLCVPHRRLVCFCRLFEVLDINKKERVGQHQREIFLFNDMLLITKLSRKPRSSAPQQYTYRHSISLQGLYVQLFQSTHYNFGIRLCRRSNDEILIMFNARNELDQSRFVDDLNESIAEMDEMEAIRSSNLVDSIYSKQQDRLRRHTMLHDGSDRPSGRRSCETGSIPETPEKEALKIIEKSNQDQTKVRETPDDHETISTNDTNSTVVLASGRKRLSAKFSSMSNLASVAETKDETERDSDFRRANHLRQNRSFAQNYQPRIENGPRHLDEPRGEISQPVNGQHRSFSTTSVHSLDSGLFLSRDISPNQSG